MEIGGDFLGEVKMESMNLFSDGDDDSTALLGVRAAGIETYGNSDIVKTLLFFFKKGLNHKENRAYAKYLDVLQQFDDFDRRDMLLGNVINPIAQYVDTNPSSENFTTFVADLYPECRKFVLDFPDVFTDLHDAIVLCENNFFSCASSAARILMIDCYGVEALKGYTFTSVPESVTLLLHQCNKYSLKEPLEEVLKLGSQLTSDQAEVLEVFCEVGGFTLEDIMSEAAFDKDRLFNIFTKVHTLLRSEALIKEEIYFLIYFLYSKYSTEEIKTTVTVDGNVFVRALFERYFNRSFGGNLRQLYYVSPALMFKCQSVEIIVDGSSVLLMPFDAALYETVYSRLDAVFANVVTAWGEYVECSNQALCNTHRNISKLVIYAYTKVNTFGSALGRRAFWLDTGVYGFDNYECEWDNDGSMLSLLYDNFNSGRPLTNLRLEGLGVSREDHFSSENIGTQTAMLIGAISRDFGGLGYELLFSREDFGVPLFHVIQNMVSPLDSLYAALLRYHLAVLKVPFSKYNHVLNLETPIVTVGTDTYNVLSILSGDKSLLVAMQERREVMCTDEVILLD